MGNSFKVKAIAKSFAVSAVIKNETAKGAKNAESNGSKDLIRNLFNTLCALCALCG